MPFDRTEGAFSQKYPAAEAPGSHRFSLQFDQSLGQYHLHRTALEVDACDELLDRRNQDPFAADLHLEEGIGLTVVVVRDFALQRPDPYPEPDQIFQVEFVVFVVLVLEVQLPPDKLFRPTSGVDIRECRQCVGLAPPFEAVAKRGTASESIFTNSGSSVEKSSGNVV